jgi:hypothetical protein
MKPSDHIPGDGPNCRTPLDCPEPYATLSEGRNPCPFHERTPK